MRKTLLSLVSAVVLCVPVSAVARPHAYVRGRTFEVPPGLGPRVGFWVKIFTAYGERQKVIHHRAFPQIVFRVLDFARDGELLGPVALERFMERETEKHMAEVKRAITNLASGAGPQNDLERHIEREMAVLGSGTVKYKNILAEDMIRSQTGIKEKFAEALRRSGRYMPTIEHIFVKEFNLPVELTRLPFIESSFDYNVRSSVGALGIWQFMPATARSYKMIVNAAVDERLDVIEATRAAAQYLQHAYNVLGTWPLALTSYNHGVTGVLRKVRQLGTTDIVRIVEHRTLRLLGFASNNFYPEFLAALEVYENYQTYFPGLRMESPLAVSEFRLPHSVSVHYVHQKVGVPVSDLMALNYGVSQAVWTGRYRLPKGYNLKVPPLYVAKLGELMRPEPVGPSASSVYGGAVYKVRKGDTLIKIASKYSITVGRLKELNNLGNKPLRVGQQLVVGAPEDGTARLKEEVVRQPVQEQSARQVEARVHVVQKGETLSGIARKAGVSAGELRSLNNLHSDALSIGQRLVLSHGQAPLSTAAPAPAAPASSYTVRSGDTLSSIAKAQRTTVAKLKSLNGLKTNNLRLGQKLKVSGGAPAATRAPAAAGKTYTVRSGDTLWGVAKKLGVSVAALKAANRLKGDALKPGQRLSVK